MKTRVHNYYSQLDALALRNRFKVLALQFPPLQKYEVPLKPNSLDNSSSHFAGHEATGYLVFLCSEAEAPILEIHDLSIIQTDTVDPTVLCSNTGT